MEEVCDDMVPRLYDKYEKENEKKKYVDGKWRKKYLPGCKLFFRWDL